MDTSKTIVRVAQGLSAWVSHHGVLLPYQELRTITRVTDSAGRVVTLYPRFINHTSTLGPDSRVRLIARIGLVEERHRRDSWFVHCRTDGQCYVWDFEYRQIEGAGYTAYCNIQFIADDYGEFGPFVDNLEEVVRGGIQAWVEEAKSKTQTKERILDEILKFIKPAQ